MSWKTKNSRKNVEKKSIKTIEAQFHQQKLGKIQ